MRIDLWTESCGHGYEMHGKCDVIKEKSSTHHQITGPAVVYKSKDKNECSNYVFGERVDYEKDPDKCGNVSGAYLKKELGLVEFGSANNNVKCGPFFKNITNNYVIFGRNNNDGRPNGFLVTVDCKNNRFEIKECVHGYIMSKGLIYEDNNLHYADFQRTDSNILPDKINTKLDLTLDMADEIKTSMFFGRFDVIDRTTKNEYLNDVKAIESGLGLSYLDKNGTTFGRYESSKLTGAGCYRSYDGILYQGNFKNQKLNGLVLVTNSNNSYHLSMYNDGVLNGLSFQVKRHELKIIRYKNGQIACDYISVNIDDFSVTSYSQDGNILERFNYPNNDKKTTVSLVSDNTEVNNKNIYELSDEKKKRLEKYEYTCQYMPLGNSYYPHIVITKCNIFDENEEVPEFVNSITSNAYGRNQTMTSLTIKGKISIIEERSFCLSSNLTELNIYDSNILAIRSEAFAYTKLVEVKFPITIALIKKDAFKGCNDLMKVYVPKKCNIEPGAFPPHTKIIYYNAAVNASNSIKESISNFFKKIGDKLFTIKPKEKVKKEEKVKKVKPAKTKVQKEKPSKVRRKPINIFKIKPFKPKEKPQRNNSNIYSGQGKYILLTIVALIICILRVANLLDKSLDGFMSDYGDLFGFNLCNLMTSWINSMDDGLIVLLFIVVAIGYVLSFILDIVSFVVLGLGFVILFILNLLYEVIFHFLMVIVPVAIIILFFVFKKKYGLCKNYYIYLTLSIIFSIVFYIFLLKSIMA